MGFCLKNIKLVIGGAVFALSTNMGNAAQCAVDVAMLRGDWGQARFSVEIADDAAERAQGLMNREQMPTMSGMLFVYEQPQNVAFWMKNTLIPLDMIFLDQAGRVLRVHEMAKPLDTTPIPGGDGVKFVLEINGGMASRLGIKAGSGLAHPQIDQKVAIWPCEMN